MVRFDPKQAAFKMVTNVHVLEPDDLAPSIGERDRHQIETDRHPTPLPAEEYQNHEHRHSQGKISKFASRLHR